MQLDTKDKLDEEMMNPWILSHAPAEQLNVVDRIRLHSTDTLALIDCLMKITGFSLKRMKITTISGNRCVVLGVGWFLVNNEYQRAKYVR